MALEHTFQEVACHTFDSSLRPFADPFGKPAADWENALSAVMAPENGLASWPHDTVDIVGVAVRIVSAD